MEHSRIPLPPIGYRPWWCQKDRYPVVGRGRVSPSTGLQRADQEADAEHEAAVRGLPAGESAAAVGAGDRGHPALVRRLRAEQPPGRRRPRRPQVRGLPRALRLLRAAGGAVGALVCRRPPPPHTIPRQLLANYTLNPPTHRCERCANTNHHGAKHLATNACEDCRQGRAKYGLLPAKRRQWCVSGYIRLSL